MKKIIAAGLIALSCTFSTLFAFSWSGVVDNSSKLLANHDFSQLTLEQSNGVYLSFSSNLNQAGNLRIAGEGLYKYYLYCPFNGGSLTFKNVADIDLLKFTGDWKLKSGSLSVNLGRFQYSDFTGAVFNQITDGAYISYNTLKIKTSIYAGYTGLLNRLNVSMAENTSSSTDQVYALCPQYVPVAADISYKALFETNTIGFQAMCFIPVTNANTLKAYGTISMNGSFGTIGSYNAKVTVGTEKFTSIMLDAKLDTNFYVNKNIMVTAGGEYVSGTQGSIKPFLSITARSFGYAPFVNGIIVPKAGVMFVKDKFYGNLTERIILAMPSDQFSFNGFDTTVNLIYNLFSDVQLGCDIAAYICTERKENSRFYTTIKASLAF